MAFFWSDANCIGVIIINIGQLKFLQNFRRLICFFIQEYLTFFNSWQWKQNDRCKSVQRAHEFLKDMPYKSLERSRDEWFFFFSSISFFLFPFSFSFSSGKNTVRSGSRTRNVGTWITSVRYLESERNIQVNLKTPKKSTTRTSDDQKFRESVSWDGIFFTVNRSKISRGVGRSVKRATDSVGRGVCGKHVKYRDILKCIFSFLTPRRINNLLPNKKKSDVKLFIIHGVLPRSGAYFAWINKDEIFLIIRPGYTVV